MWTLYFSQFFTSFFIGLRRICWSAKVHSLYHLFISCRNWLWLIIQKLNESYIFLNEEHALVLNFQNAENRILGLFLGKHIISRLLPTTSDQSETACPSQRYCIAFLTTLILRAINPFSLPETFKNWFQVHQNDHKNVWRLCIPQCFEHWAWGLGKRLRKFQREEG